MSEMTMIERVARALAHSAGARMLTQGQSVATREFGWDANHSYTDKYIEAHWKEHVHAAGFAIEAMREPPKHGLKAVAGVPVSGPYLDAGDAEELWEAMIDAALASPIQETQEI